MAKLWISAITLVLPSFTLFLGAQAASKDEEKLQGTWSIVSMERGGTKMPEDEAKKLKVTFKDNKVIVSGGPRDETATFKLDAAKKPKAIDFNPGKDGKDEKPEPGIYDLDGDTLKVCWIKGSGERPTEFASKPDSGTNLVVLKREKK